MKYIIILIIILYTTPIYFFNETVYTEKNLIKIIYKEKVIGYLTIKELKTLIRDKEVVKCKQ